MEESAALRMHQDTPNRLKFLCCKKVIRHLADCVQLIPSTRVPTELGHLLFEEFRRTALMERWPEEGIARFLRLFQLKLIPLSRINLSGLPLSNITDAFLSFASEYADKLVEIDLSDCGHMDLDMGQLNRILERNKDAFKTLIIGDSFSKMIEKMESSKSLFDDDVKLKRLVIHSLYPCTSLDEFKINRKLSQILSFSMSNTLKYLDLSKSAIGSGSALVQLKELESLILYNCSMTYPNIIVTICQLQELRVLDVSRQATEAANDAIASQDEHDMLVDLIVDRLPKLTRLDISGTNLVNGKDRNISAFETRMNRPFEFLGLFHTGHDTAYKSCIPAKIVAGEANESQMLNACEAYLDRPGQLSEALGDLYNLYKTLSPTETFADVNRALNVVLPILTKHIQDEQVIIFTTAALFCIVKINVTTKNLNDARLRQTITSRLLDVMHYHKSSRVILINGGLTLLFLPDIICEHSRVAAISLSMCEDSDPRTQGFGTTLLNTLACQVGGDQKIFIGELHAIETMISIIRNKIKHNTCDEVLETAWSTLWNITDETPINCEKFLANGGLEAFENCMDKFSDNKEVLRNIMGLLGNVAECKRLRVRFMKEDYIKRFYFLLSSNIDGIECSYNSCGTLAYLVSDGEEFWNTYLPNCETTRKHVLDRMRNAISTWPIHSKRNINYRSFEPIIRLLDTHIVAEAQYWAVFALTNLTRINPTKYCPMLVCHNGLEKMRLLTRPGVTEAFVTNLAKVAVYQYERFEAEGTLAGLECTDSIDLEVICNFRATESTQNDATSDIGEVAF